MVFNINNYIYLVPYVETKDEIFLKTIVPSRKATKKYLENKHENLDKEEKEILDSFEHDEWRSVKDPAIRKAGLEESARATIRKDKRVNIRISERDLKELKRIALREGLPYQTLISSILHKYVNGTPITGRRFLKKNTGHNRHYERTPNG